MGRVRSGHRAHHARRDVHRAARTRVRTKDLDLIQDDMRPENRPNFEKQPINEELPGLGQHYCIECAKYYETDAALKTHSKSKIHRRRLKELRDPAYTVEEAYRSGGVGVDNRQRGVEEIVSKMEDGGI